jgi:hypothetical protein
MEQKSQEIETKKGKRVNPGKLILTSYHNISIELKNRGVSEYSFDEFIEDLFCSVSNTFSKDVITERTPLEYKLKLALSDESKKAAILKIIDTKISKKISKVELEHKSEIVNNGEAYAEK